MEKTCAQCQSPFTIRPEDRVFYEKMKVPRPTQCPRCRNIRRHGHINDYVFYTRPCDHCQKSFVSIFPPKSDYIVYCQPCWFAEDRDDKAQGRDYDFSRPFFEQFDDLMHAVPQLGTVGMNNENCDFCESVANCRNCYLISESSNCEDSYFCYWIQLCKNVLDCNYSHECERSYELENCSGCFNLKYSRDCQNCSDSHFLDNCIGCKDCLFSTNLRHKQYYIFNKPYSKEDYFRELEKMNFGRFEQVELLKGKFEEFLRGSPRKHLQIERTENASGDYIRNAKNCHGVFHCYDAEECAYGEHVWRGAKNCMDANTAGRNAEWLYETTNCGLDSFEVRFSRYCWGGRNVEYSNTCMRSLDIFGCAGLKPNSRYCVLNRQYTKSDYEALITRIREKMLSDGEYGEFFPLSISLFGYNNSVSFDDAPMTKEEAHQRGWKWEDQKSGVYGKGNEEILTCGNCERNYKLIPHELKFYQKEGIPLPRRCPDCRLRSRLALHHRKVMRQVLCAECGKKTPTTLDPEAYPKILCSECYLKLV